MLQRLIFLALWLVSEPEAFGDAEWRTETCASDPARCVREAYTLANEGREAPATILRIRACRQGNGPACAEVGWYLFHSGEKQDAEVLLNHSCNQGYGPSCHHLAAMRRYRGELVQASIAQRRACNLQIADACKPITQVLGH